MCMCGGDDRDMMDAHIHMFVPLRELVPLRPPVDRLQAVPYMSRCPEAAAPVRVWLMRLKSEVSRAPPVCYLDTGLLHEYILCLSLCRPGRICECERETRGTAFVLDTHKKSNVAWAPSRPHTIAWLLRAPSHTALEAALLKHEINEGQKCKMALQTSL